MTNMWRVERLNVAPLLAGTRAKTQLFRLVAGCTVALWRHVQPRQPAGMTDADVCRLLVLLMGMGSREAAPERQQVCGKISAGWVSMAERCCLCWPCSGPEAVVTKLGSLLACAAFARRDRAASYACAVATAGMLAPVCALTPPLPTSQPLARSTWAMQRTGLPCWRQCQACLWLSRGALPALLRPTSCTCTAWSGLCC